jgi:hypothetical protein
MRSTFFVPLGSGCGAWRDSSTFGIFGLVGMASPAGLVMIVSPLVPQLLQLLQLSQQPWLFQPENLLEMRFTRPCGSEQPHEPQLEQLDSMRTQPLFV